ncbi:MAG: hypothetical protein GY710_04745 [Desulfobacteraceae bacterium]|nr:hypothetical protein [Desulfobacteraceae bacterium]
MSTTTVFAHKVIVFAWVEDGRIHVQGSFGSNRPIKNCVIQVKRPGGILIHQAITDIKGLCSFDLPDHLESDLIVELNAGPGHLGQWTIPKDELIYEVSPEILEKKMIEKQALEKSPSPTRIATGIALIFGLAFVVARVKKTKCLKTS